MKNHRKRRVHDGTRYLTFLLKENEEFYVGLLFEDFIKSIELKKYGLPNSFEDNKKVTPLAKGSVTIANLNGKYTRKFPEEKTTKMVHIKYTRKRDGRLIEYDREYNVYLKELQHRYNIPFTFKENKHGQKLIVSNILRHDNSSENKIRNTHVINLFCEIFNDFEIFTSDLEPAIHFNKKFEKDLLPKGNLNSQSTFEEVVKFAGNYTKNEEEQKAFQRRLHILKDHNPDIRGKGPNDFYGYIVFGFTDLQVAVLETMYDDNATYVFNLKDYEANVIKDKQSALKDKSLIKRFYHDDNWENKIESFLNSLKKAA